MRARLIGTLYIAVLSLLTPLVANKNPYWVDEEITVMLLSRWDVVELIVTLPVYQPHLPLWYVIGELGGVGVLTTLSYLAFPCTAVLTLWTAIERGYTDQSAFLAGLLIAVSPFLATQASWIRMYAVFTTLGALFLYTNARGAYARSVLVALVAALLHPFGAILGWVGGLDAVPNLKRMVVTGGMPSLPLAYLLYMNTLYQGKPELSAETTGMGHGTVPSVLDLFLSVFSPIVGTPHSLIQVVLLVFVSGVLLSERADTWALCVALFGIAVLAVGSLVHPVFTPKYLGFVAPAVALWIASHTQNRSLVYAPLAVVVFLSWAYRLNGVIIARRFIYWF